MTRLERIARAICTADGVDPDAEGYGLGVQMPAGERYPLWKAREKQAAAADAASSAPDMLEALEPFAARATSPGADKVPDNGTVTFYMSDVRAALAALNKAKGL